jgi:hypothetical protein
MNMFVDSVLWKKNKIKTFALIRSKTQVKDESIGAYESIKADDWNFPESLDKTVLTKTVKLKMLDRFCFTKSSEKFCKFVSLNRLISNIPNLW